MLPIRLALGALAAAVLLLDSPLSLAPIVVMGLSLGYDRTQPLFGGIVTALGGKRTGQAMGLNVFALFVGFGLGSIIFGELLHAGFGPALWAFAAVELSLAVGSLWLFRSEMPRHTTTGGDAAVR